MDAVAQLGRNLGSKDQIQSEYGDEQADAGRDCRTCLARPNSQARTRTGKADDEQDWQPYPIDPYSCYCAVYSIPVQVIIRTYIIVRAGEGLSQAKSPAICFLSPSIGIQPEHRCIDFEKSGSSAAGSYKMSATTAVQCGACL